MMSNNVDFKEVRNLIKDYSTLLENLKNINKYVQKYEIEIKNNADKLLYRKYFQKVLDNDLTNNNINQINFEKSKDFLKSIYCYNYAIKFSTQGMQLYNNNSKAITQRINDVSHIKNAVLNIFTSSQNKQIAQEAYKELKDGKNESFYILAKEVLSSLDNLKNIVNTEIYSSFIEDTITFRESFEKIYQNNVAYDDNKKIKKVLSDYKIFENKIRKIVLEHISAKDQCKQSIDRLIAIELINTLKQIPINELNRDKSGIRVKNLIDAGYTSIADIYGFNESQLASLPGISYPVAKQIKSKMNIYVENAKKDIKIKLNADQKNEYSTKLVCDLFDYIEKDKITEQVLKFYNDNNSDIQNATIELSKIKDGVIYFLSSNIEKQKYLEKYNYLNEIVDNKLYIQSINDTIKKLENYKKVSNDIAWADFTKDPIKYFNIIEKIFPKLLEKSDSLYGLPEKLAREIQEQDYFPDGLLCSLRRYQEWGVKYILHQEKVLLGDEMGLGKTIQAIATMVSLRNTGATHFVVVCTASVLENWCREITKHSKLTVTKVHGQMKRTAFRSWLETGGVAVTTYETTKYFEFDDNYKFSLLTVDEAQYIKNPNASRTKNAINLSKHAERLLFMTGTAIENNVDEMINLINILNPKIANDVSKIAFLSAAPQFRKKIASVYYRRKREDVLTELPEKIEKQEWCIMNPEEERKYEESVLYGSYPEARRLSWNIDDLNESSKAVRLKEIVNEAKEDGRKVLVFSFFLETIQKIKEYLGEICTEPITGAVSPQNRQKIIDEFDKSPAGTVLIAQIVSGGVGLNIQSASVVVICEPQFKPSTETQAISRAYRMGQARNVLVFRLLCENTIDEKITKMLERKQKVFDAFADKSVAAEKSKEIEKSLEINNKEKNDIIKEEINRICEKRGIDPIENINNKIKRLIEEKPNNIDSVANNSLITEKK